MDQPTLFANALGLTAPWHVARVNFAPQQKQLDIYLDFARGSRFACPQCGTDAPAYDTSDETWRHLDFFQHAAYLHARVPRVECGRGCGVAKISVPWARSGSGFTLLFEALIMSMIREMPVAAVAALVGEHDTRLWRIAHHYTEAARARRDDAAVKRVGVDETAARRRHNYISLFFDMDARRLLFATPGKDAATIEAFAEDLRAHGGATEQITEVCCDMSPAFIKGWETSLPQAALTFDRFHLMKLMGDAVDQVRREEARTQSGLKQTRYLWLMNPSRLSVAEQAQVARLSRQRLKTAKAYQLRLVLQEFFAQDSRAAAETFLKRWYFWATHTRLAPLIKVAKTIKAHWAGILNWYDSKLTTGLLEGINSLIQAAKARARGYRTSKNLITMAYLIAGKLDFKLPT